MEFAASQCEICAKKGVISWKRWHQLNRDEAISFCENLQCSDMVDGNDMKAKIKPRKMTDWVPNSPIKENLPMSTVAPDSVNTSVSCTNNSDDVESMLNGLFPDTDLRENFEQQGSTTMPKFDFNSALNRLSPCKMKNESEADTCELPTLNRAFSQLKLPLSQNSTTENQPEVILKLSTVPDSTPDQLTTLTPLPTKPELAEENIYNEPVLLGNQSREETEKNLKELQPVPVSNQMDIMKYPQWTNKDALCWLDVTLNLLVHNNAVKREISCLNGYSVVKTIHAAYYQVVSIYNSIENKNLTARRLQGCVSQADIEATAIMDSKTDALLEVIRDKTFEFLKNKLQCMRGQEESPVFALPHLLQEEAMQKLFSIHYNLVFECDLCKFRETRSTQKVILTLPRVCNEFSVMNAFILTSCPRCEGQNQKRSVKFDRLPSCVIMHFVEGLSNLVIDRYDFEFKHLQYKVTCIVQYKKNPNHFIVWIRDLNDDLWMECDDLKPVPSYFHLKSPTTIDPSECHLLVWECISSNKSSICSLDIPFLQNRENELNNSLDHDYCGQLTNDDSSVKHTSESCENVTTSGKKDDDKLLAANADVNLPIPNCLQLLDEIVEASTECQDLVKHEPVNNFETFSEVLNLDREPPITIPSFMLDSNPQIYFSTGNSQKINENDLFTHLPNSKSVPDSIPLPTENTLKPNPQVIDVTVNNLLPSTATTANKREDQNIVLPNSTAGTTFPSSKYKNNAFPSVDMTITDCTLIVTPELKCGFVRPMPITLSCENAIELLKKFNKPVNFIIKPPEREIIPTTALVNIPVPQVPNNIHQDPGLCEFSPHFDSTIANRGIINQPNNRRYTRRGIRAGRGQGRRPRRSRGGSRTDNGGFMLQENSFGVDNQLVQNFNQELPSNTSNHFPIESVKNTTLIMQPGQDLGTNLNNTSLLQFALKSKSNPAVVNSGPVANPGLKRKMDNPSAELPKGCTPPIVKRINGTGVQLVRNNFPPSRRSSRSFDSYQLKSSK